MPSSSYLGKRIIPSSPSSFVHKLASNLVSSSSWVYLVVHRTGCPFRFSFHLYTTGLSKKEAYTCKSCSSSQLQCISYQMRLWIVDRARGRGKVVNSKVTTIKQPHLKPLEYFLEKNSSANLMVFVTSKLIWYQSPIYQVTQPQDTRTSATLQYL